MVPAVAAIRPRFPTWLLAAILGLLTMALYWPATQNDFVNYDDGIYVSSNVHVQNGLTLEGIKWAFSNPLDCSWLPLTMLSHMLDCQLYGLKPWGHHLTSLLLHSLNTVLIFLLLRRLTGATWRSAMVAALFACHPLHVESVAWVAERKDVLSACFGFLALLFYVRYAQGRTEENKGQEAERRNEAVAFYLSPFYWLAWFCFALGLMSKPMLVTWPFVLWLLDYWPLERFKPGRVWSLVAEKIPFFVLSAAASVVTFVVQQQEGAMSALENLPLGMRFENALISYCRYLLKILWPTDLAVFYPYPDHYWPLKWALLSGFLLTGLSVLWWVKRQRHPFLLVGWLWFVGTLVPVIGLVQVGLQAMADRYTYIPSVGVLILIVWGAYNLSRRWRHQMIALSVAGSAAIVLCSALTRQQIGYWKDTEALFRRAVNVTKNNYVAHNNLGCALAIKGQTDAAISQYLEAIRLKPDDADSHNNLGAALLDKGRTDVAISQCQEAIRLKPDYAEAHYNLGNALGHRGQTGAAISQYQEAIRLKPDYAEAHCNLGITLLKIVQIDAAIIQFQEAIRLKSDYAEAHYNLGIAFGRKGQTDAAISQYQETIRLKPDDFEAHYNLGTTFGRLGQIDGAISQFQEALRLKPNDAETRNNLGTALGQKGQIDGAINQFREALRLKPDYAEARDNLTRALQMKNAPAEH